MESGSDPANALPSADNGQRSMTNIDGAGQKSLMMLRIQQKSLLADRVGMLIYQ